MFLEHAFKATTSTMGVATSSPCDACFNESVTTSLRLSLRVRRHLLDGEFYPSVPLFFLGCYNLRLNLALETLAGVSQQRRRHDILSYIC